MLEKKTFRNHTGRKVRYIAICTAPCYGRPLTGYSRKHVLYVRQLLHSQILTRFDCFFNKKKLVAQYNRGGAILLDSSK